MRSLPLYWRFISISVRAKTEYRTAFALTFLARGIVWTTEFALIWVLLYTFKSIAGWTSYEVMFLYALQLTTYSLAAFFCFHPFTKLSYKIQSGEFDELLTKPINPLLYLMCREFSASYVANVTFGIAFLSICIYRLELTLGVSDVLFLLAVLAGGALIQASAFMYGAIPSFWMVRNTSIMEMLMSDFRSFIRYPISIYPSSVQVILTLLVPFAFINFYPAHYFLGRDDSDLFHPLLVYMTPLVGVILFGGALLLWRAGVRRYHSTGS
jgi:ABC-type uncharacterized transport system, permease component